MRRLGGGTSAAGPRMRGNGSTRASALRIGPEGGSASFSLREDRRALDVLAVARARPASAARRRPRSRPGRGPSVATSSAPPTPSTTSAARNESRRLMPSPSASKTIAANPPTISARHEAEQRRVGRARALVEQQRCQPAADERAARESRPATARSRPGPGRNPTAPSAQRTPTMIQSIAVMGNRPDSRVGALCVYKLAPMERTGGLATRVPRRDPARCGSRVRAC